jgi:putative salt-induced outer membrane protein YdiY
MVFDRRQIRHAVCVLLAVFCCAVPLAAKRKDDVVIMKNGDRFTGEIKGLTQGELSFKASYMSSSVRLNWKDVERLESKDTFIVSLTDGRRISGFIDAATPRDGEAVVHISSEGVASAVPHSDVVGIEQQETRFLNQLYGSFDTGFSFSSGHNTTDNSTALDVGYRTQRNLYSLDASSDYNRNNAESTARHQLTLQQQHMLTEKWFSAALVDFLHSEQQELSLRSTFGGGLGRKLFQTEYTSLAAIGGAVFTRESYSSNFGGTPDHNNAEALLALQFSTFRFKTMNVRASTSIFPSMSDPGRFRVNADGSVKIELVRNLYWKFRVYENFDNKPPVNAPRNDAGLSNALGWSF